MRQLATLCRYTLFGLAMLVSAYSAADTSASEALLDSILPVENPAQGIFLVANPNMPDPRFQGSVILLLEHGSDGTLGLIINKPIRIPLAEALPEIDSIPTDQQLFVGGPVSTNSMIMLFQSRQPPDHVQHVAENIYWSASRLALEAALTQNSSPESLRVYLGHSGWGPKQLAGELAEHSWYLFKAAPAIIFRHDPDRLWRQFIDRRTAGWILVRHNGYYDPLGAQRWLPKKYSSSYQH